MASETNNLDAGTNFFGKVSKPLEMVFVGVSLGAPIQYKKDQITGLTNVCMLVPSKTGTQPTVVTFGRDDSVGNAAYEAFYHRLNIEKIISSSNKEAQALTDKDAVSVLVDTFQRVFNLGIGNNYTEEILNSKFEALGPYVRDYYPEYNQPYSQVKDLLVQELKERYSGKSDAERNAEKHPEGGEGGLDDLMKEIDKISTNNLDSDEKKTTTGTVTRNFNGADA